MARQRAGGDRRATMADVGRLAGVSPTTVSFVVNGTDEPISEATRQRVLDAVAELDYRPNRTARGLRTRRTATIGFVTDEIAVDPFAGATILGAHEVAWANGTLIMVVNTTRDRRILSDVINELVDRPVDAIIFAVVGARRVSVPDSLKGVPAILLNGYITGGMLPSVLPDEAEGGRRAAELLLAEGHQRIAYLAGYSTVWATRARLRGFGQALKAYGVPRDGQVVLHGNYRPDSGYDLTRQLLARGPAPTAIMCGNDRMAVGVYLALAEAGLRIPQDVSVVGYDDQAQLGEFLRPSLSTVRLPYHHMGRWAAEQLLHGDVHQLPARTYLPCPVVNRDSVAVPRG